MDGLIATLNHLIAVALAEYGGGATWHILRVTLDADGGRVEGRIDHPAMEGGFVLALRAEPPQGGRQKVHLWVEQWPEQLPRPLEALRPVLEKLRLQFELEFNP